MSRENLLRQLARLRRFILVGLIAAGVDIGVMQLLILAGGDPLAARAVSLPLAMFCAWRLNRRYTFGPSGRGEAEEAVRYGMVASLAALINYLVFASLIEFLPGIWPSFAAAAGIATSMWVSFTGLQLFAFSKRSQGPGQFN